MVITRNNSAPVFIIENGVLTQLTDPVDPVGIRRGIRPQITEISISPGLTTICYTDGITYAGDRNGKRFEVESYIRQLMSEEEATPQDWADALLAEALKLDDDRPVDDMSVVVASILPKGERDIRRLTARMPLK